MLDLCVEVVEKNEKCQGWVGEAKKEERVIDGEHGKVLQSTLILASVKT